MSDRDRERYRDRDTHLSSRRSDRERSYSRRDYDRDDNYDRYHKSSSRHDSGRDRHRARGSERDRDSNRHNSRDLGREDDRRSSSYDHRSHRRRRDRSLSPDRSKRTRRDDNRDSKPSRPRDSNVKSKQGETEDQKVMKWVAAEDQFALKQMKHGAVIRIQEGRSKPVDWLAANLRLIEGDPSVYDADSDPTDMDFEIPVPYAIVEGLNLANIISLEKDIQKYMEIDKHPRNAEFWSMMQILCQSRQESLEKDSTSQNSSIQDDLVQPVSEDIDAVLSGKSFDELLKLEKQVQEMIRSDDPSIDLDFWQRLLKELTIRKAKAKLDQIHELVIAERLKRLRKSQHAEALRSRMQIVQLLEKGTRTAAKHVEYAAVMDEIPKNISIDQIEMNEGIKIQRIDISVFIKNLETSRKEVQRLGFVPMKTTRSKDHPRYIVSEFNEAKKAVMSTNSAYFSNSFIQHNPDDPKSLEGNAGDIAMLPPDGNDNEEEEFNGDDTIIPIVPNNDDGNNSSDSNLQKPRFYNRVILGYEWNRYNQIHYNSNNPPPKIVQGYKFNIFYPDLIDSKKAPTFSIIRDKHKSHKHLATAAGQNDTCIINFHAGPPYQDLAFKIVDRQWDNSTHRGSRCKFENGVLQVYFRFKRVYYRK